MKNKLGNTKGITLIALVITIVILIILAGVAINLTLGENGIFKRAESAKEQYEMTVVQEKINLAILEIQTEEINNAELTQDTILTKLKIKLPAIQIEKDGEKLKGIINGYDFVIDSYLNVTIEGYNPDSGNAGENQTPTIEKYIVTLNGSNVTSNGSTQVNKNESYTATLTATEGYGIAALEVKMGSTTLTGGTHYTYTDGILTIANVTGNIEINVTAYETVESQKTSATTAETYYSTEKILIDSSGNIVKVPVGFKVAQDSGVNVTEGIVIEDSDIISGIGNDRGNQYVWVPVGEDIKKADGTTVDITLGRYKFADGTTTYTDSEENTLSKGTPILVQSIDNYTDQSSNIQIVGISNRLFYEVITQRAGTASAGTGGLNATALSILNFKTSVASKHGYYIARYEASYGATDKKANSKVSNSAGATAPTTEGTLWNCVTQINAATASRGIYSTVTSDLINSYAWDTAIVYIQEFSNDSDYSYETSKNSGSPTNTGENDDEICNINDMASNVREWTTEYCTYKTKDGSGPCTHVGGNWNDSSNYTSSRNSTYATNSISRIGFRIILY